MLLSLEELGIHPFYYQKLKRAMEKPQGMILTTGPTGSGKTTTLYACLKKIATPEVKVITIEDPIEYHLEGIDQTQVDHKKGYTFPVALRAALRQDPDIILVGEIRDMETAQTAIQAALTGHLVFSTLHTNDAAGIVPRLVEMGITASTIPAALNLGMAQRLLRRLCKKCKKEIEIPVSIWEKIEKNIQNIPKEYLPDISKKTFFLPRGCKDCYFTGYRGRIGIYEMFEITPKLEEMINFSPSISQMRKALKEEGMITMQQDGLLRVLEGETSLEELQKVTGPLE
jgi:type II secretory ATPase GspE/PulE/Tfp pilus assembly ATPase PilB-like protein